MPAVPALVKALDDDDARVRSNAAWALGDIGPSDYEGVTPALILLLEDESSIVRQNAAEAPARSDRLGRLFLS